MERRIKTAIFLSGEGTNARNLLQYFSKPDSCVSIDLLLTNTLKSGAENICNDFDIPLVVFNRQQFYKEETVKECLLQSEIELVILAGFLWLIPENMIKSFPNRIINIHPALLPKYGGKGMYGMRVHDAVYNNKEKETGITIHLVNEEYDKGKVLFQEVVSLTDKDTPQTIAKKVHELEYKYFPVVVEEYVQQLQ